MKAYSTFKALSDPTRITILKSIEKKERCICEIIPLTRKSQPNVSQHIKVLKHAGLIKEKKEGTKIMISPTTDKIYDLIQLATHMT